MKCLQKTVFVIGLIVLMAGCGGSNGGSNEGSNGGNEDFYLTSPIPGNVSYVVSATWRKDYGAGPHLGIDYDIPTGTPILAVAPGEVFYADMDNAGELVVRMTHSGGFITYIGHLGTTIVKKGQKVSRGEIIGTCGTSPGVLGRPHIHLSLYTGPRHEDMVDPQLYFR
jgi:murein DD-endopeptidase MepM/ murein hydrolase activator NlpD